MSLVVVAHPQTESELSVMLCMLHAQEIPAFVQGQGFGSLYPGPQVAGYNARRIMVPAPLADTASELLSVLDTAGRPKGPVAPVRAKDVVRLALELLFFGWFIPGTRRRGMQAKSGPGERNGG